MTSSCPFGRYQYRRLLFGAASVGSMSEKKIHEFYNDIRNVFGIAGYILIASVAQMLIGQSKT